MRSGSLEAQGSRSGRILLASSIAFAAGIAAHGRGGDFAACVGIAMAWFIRPPARDRPGPRSPALRRLGAAAALLAAALAAGLACAVLHGARDGTASLLESWRRLGFEEGITPVRVRGVLIDRDRLEDDRLSLTLRMTRCAIPAGAEGGTHAAPGIGIRLTLPWPGDRPIPWREGDTLETVARLGRARRFRNPGSFDYPAYLATRGISLTGSVKSALLVEYVAGSRHPWIGLLPRARRRVVATLQDAAGPAQAQTADFLAALLVGERQSLPPDLEETLQRAGVYHIIALSGFNVGLVALLGGALLGLAPLRPRIRRIALLALLLAYWGIARDSGSLARAALMVLLHGAGALASRRVAPTGAIAVSALILLAVEPGWLFDAGFQLSYLATLGLFAGAGPRAGRAHPAGAARARRPLVPEPLRAAFRASLVALAATSPLTARQFHSITPGGALANLIAVPASSACLLIALLIVPAQPVAPSLAHAGVLLASFLLALLRGCAAACAALPGGFVRVLPPSWTIVLLLLALLGAAARARRAPLRRAAGTLAILVAIAVVASGRSPSPPGRLEVTVLDVGQGDALLVRFPNGLSMLVDAGGLARSEFDVGARVVAPALRSLGLLRIDLLAITHAHHDHIGGAVSIVREFRPRAVWLGAMTPSDRAVRRLESAAAEVGASVLRPLRGVVIGAGGGSIEVLHPAAGARPGAKGANDDSLVLRLVYRRAAALLTGDIERPVEQDLVASGLPIDAGLLKVAHHGSETSSTAAFLSRVGARIAVVSVGAGNPWGHPSRAVLQRIAEAGALVARTDQDGAVRAWSAGDATFTVERLTDGAGEATSASGASLAAEDLRGGRDEAEDENENAEQGDGEAAAPERREVVDRPWMGDTDEREQRSENQQVPSLERETAGEQRGDPESRDDTMRPGGDGVEHVSAVELADRQQVQRGGEQAEPGGREHGVQLDRSARLELEEVRIEPVQQQAIGQADRAGLRHGCDQRGMEEPVVENRERGGESCERPRDGHVEQRPPARERRPYPDDRSERAKDVRSGQKERERGLDSVVATDQIVPHLVRPEDEQNSRRIRQSAQPSARRTGDPRHDPKRVGIFLTEERSGDDSRGEGDQQAGEVDDGWKGPPKTRPPRLQGRLVARRPGAARRVVCLQPTSGCGGSCRA
ncbi:MAG TPA: DNA internalization-related competence protein ComEC/Rec2 [Patescibacteria group bacterium]|nr:DNA internalization-related competence protein ComEC/Rec2 [Patescibacteria group bacterium]